VLAAKSAGAMLDSFAAVATKAVVGSIQVHAVEVPTGSIQVMDYNTDVEAGFAAVMPTFSTIRNTS
jgi:hypothetical protein